MDKVAKSPTIGKISAVRSRKRSSSVGLLFVLLFSLSQFLFMAQSWTASNFAIPLQVLIVWLLMAWAILLHMTAVKRALLIFSKLQWFVILLLAGSIMLRSGLDGWDMLRFSQLITGVMIALLGSLVFYSDRGRKILLMTLSLGAVLSSGLAIIQYLDAVPWLWWATKYAGIGYIYGSTGLENSPVSFAYSILGVGTIVVGSSVLLFQRRLRVLPLSSTVIFLSSIIITVGLVMSKSRSGMLGLILGITLIVFSKRISRSTDVAVKGKISSSTISSATARFVLIAYIASLGLVGLIVIAFIIRETGPFQDLRALETWRVYLPLIWRYPLGLPAAADLFQTLDQVVSSAYLDLLQRTGGSFILPHNLFLTTGVNYGIVALFALLILYVSALHKGLRAFRKSRQTQNWKAALWILLLIGANVAILSHSWFHNASLAMGEMRNWLWLGLLLAAARIPTVD